MQRRSPLESGVTRQFLNRVNCPFISQKLLCPRLTQSYGFAISLVLRDPLNLVESPLPDVGVPYAGLCKHLVPGDLGVLGTGSHFLQLQTGISELAFTLFLAVKCAFVSSEQSE